MIDYHVFVNGIYFTRRAFLYIQVRKQIFTSMSYHYSRKLTWNKHRVLDIVLGKKLSSVREKIVFVIN